MSRSSVKFGSGEHRPVRHSGFVMIDEKTVYESF